MKKFLTIFSVVLVLGLFSTNVSKAQLPDGAFGIGTSFSNGTPSLSGMYAFSPSFDLGLSLGYTSNSSSIEANNNKVTSTSSETAIGLTARYFFVDNKRIDPFFSLGFGYGTADNTPDNMGLSFMFGGQTQIAENFFVYIATGIGYNSSSETVSDVTRTNSQITFMTTSVGAIVYFK